MKDSMQVMRGLVVLAGQSKVTRVWDGDRIVAKGRIIRSMPCSLKDINLPRLVHTSPDEGVSICKEGKGVLGR